LRTRIARQTGQKDLWRTPAHSPIELASAAEVRHYQVSSTRSSAFIAVRHSAEQFSGKTKWEFIWKQF